MHCRNTKIALAVRPCSEIVLPLVNTQHQHLKHEPLNLTGLHVFALKTNVFLMVLKWQLPSDMDRTCIAEMSKSLSPYACAAKTLFGAATNVNNSIRGSQKCV